MVGTIVNCRGILGDKNLVAQSSSVSKQYVNYSDDAAYVASEGSPVNGSVYYNTSLGCVRVYSNGSWYNDLELEPWKNSTDYLVGQVVWAADFNIYRCAIMHTSSAFPATIDDDSINWVRMGAHYVGDLKDVYTTGVLDRDVLVWDDVAKLFKPENKGLFKEPITVPILAVEPPAPAVGFVTIYGLGKTIYAKYSSGEVLEMLKQYDVVDFLDSNTLNAATIDNTGVAYLQVVAALAADVKAVQIFDTAGINLGWFDGLNNLLFISGPGTNETTQVEIPAGTEIKVRALVPDGAAFSGNYAVNFLG